jgi:hypothetical protein
LEDELPITHATTFNRKKEIQHEKLDGGQRYVGLNQIGLFILRCEIQNSLVRGC